MRPETKALYPDNWTEISAAYIEKCNSTCKDCQRHGDHVRVILTTHHIDYDPSNNDESNFACLCQGCHLRRQARDLSDATKYFKVELLMRMGQLCFQGFGLEKPKNIPPVAIDRVLTMLPGSRYHAQLGIEQSPGPIDQVGRG